MRPQPRETSGKPVAHADDTVVKCYNLDGIPLIELNKTHSGILNPSLDSYDLQTSSIARLGIRSGGAGVIATQNVQYEILVPQIQRMLLPKTDMTARVQTITGTSINDGQTLSQNSFSNTGESYDVNLSEDNYNGGELILFKGKEVECKEFNLPGSAVVFPSFTNHKVNKLTSGNRNTLAIWMTGPKFR